MTTHSWDENPQGIWTLELVNKGDYRNNGHLQSFILQLYGTDEIITDRMITSSVIGECVMWNMEGLCQRCQAPFYIFRKMCLSYCPPKYYKTSVKLNTAENETEMDNVSNICAACHPSCYSCNGSFANNCTACPPFSLYDNLLLSCSAPVYPYAPRGDILPNRVSNNLATAAVLLGAPIALLCVFAIVTWLLSLMVKHTRRLIRGRQQQEEAVSSEASIIQVQNADEILAPGYMGDGQRRVPLSPVLSNSP